MKTQKNNMYRVIEGMAIAMVLVMGTVTSTTTWAVSNPDLEKALKVCSKQYAKCQGACKTANAAATLKCINSKCKDTYNKCRKDAEAQYK